MIKSSTDYKQSVFAPIREVKARATITMDAFSQLSPFKKTLTFDDNKIISAKIVEEISVLNMESPSNQLTLTLDNTDGFFNFLTLNNIETIIASRPKVFMEFAVVLSNGKNEWVPMGTFFIDSWKNNVGNMSITFTCHDYLLMLSNISFSKRTITNAYDLAVSIFNNANIKSYYVEPRLVNYVGNLTKTWSTNSRDLLQNIAIATSSTLWQDRYGVVRLQSIDSILLSNWYTTYTTSQSSLYGYVASSVYPILTTDSGMRAISLDDAYEIPSVTLDSSIYQLNINVYESGGNSNPTQYTYTNSDLNGSNGDSYSIDIPLITSTEIADEVAQRFFNETKFNAVYNARWRQNPVLTTMDIIIVDDGIRSSKQTRVTKQEFIYSGYLTGTTESRGGI